MHPAEFGICFNVVDILRTDLQEQAIEVRVIVEQTLAELVVLAGFLRKSSDRFNASFKP